MRQMHHVGLIRAGRGKSVEKCQIFRAYKTGRRLFKVFRSINPYQSSNEEVFYKDVEREFFV